MNYRIHKKLNEITKSLIQYHLHLNKSCNHITKVNFCLLFSIFSESLLISFYVHSLQIWSIIFHTCVMSFRSGNHLLVVLQLSTPVLLPQQLQLLGDVKWGNSVTKRQTNKQKGKKRTNKQTSRVANWTICPNICYCLRRTVTYQNMDLWWLFLGTSWKFWGILTLTWAMWKHLTRCSHHRNIWTFDADPSFSNFFSGEKNWLLIDPWRKV